MNSVVAYGRKRATAPQQRENPLFIQINEAVLTSGYGVMKGGGVERARKGGSRGTCEKALTQNSKSVCEKKNKRRGVETWPPVEDWEPVLPRQRKGRPGVPSAQAKGRR